MINVGAPLLHGDNGGIIIRKITGPHALLGFVDLPAEGTKVAALTDVGALAVGKDNTQPGGVGKGVLNVFLKIGGDQIPYINFLFQNVFPPSPFWLRQVLYQ